MIVAEVRQKDNDTIWHYRHLEINSVTASLGIRYFFAFRCFDSLHVTGTVRAVFRPIGAREKQTAAHSTPLCSQPVIQGCFQLPVLWQHRITEPLAQQRIGNALNTDAFLPIVQSKAVAAVVVAAFMHQPPRSAILLIVHHRDGVMWHRFHSASVKPPKEKDVNFSCKTLLSSCRWNILRIPAGREMIVWLALPPISASAWIRI